MGVRQGRGPGGHRAGAAAAALPGWAGSASPLPFHRILRVPGGGRGEPGHTLGVARLRTPSGDPEIPLLLPHSSLGRDSKHPVVGIEGWQGQRRWGRQRE